MQQLYSSGILWARIHFDWSISIGRYDNSKGRIPAVVLCSRDRIGAKRYIQAVCNGESVDDVNLEIDGYDKELSEVVKGWVVDR